MSATVQELQPTNKATRYTGFPEPFNDERNTTLPHPDADLSPNACIESTESLSRSSSRHHSLRLRLRSRKSSRHGKLSTDSGISMGYDRRNGHSETPISLLMDDSSLTLNEELVAIEKERSFNSGSAVISESSSDDEKLGTRTTNRSADGRTEKKHRHHFWSSSHKN